MCCVRDEMAAAIWHEVGGRGTAPAAVDQAADDLAALYERLNSQDVNDMASSHGMSGEDLVGFALATGAPFIEAFAVPMFKVWRDGNELIWDGGERDIRNPPDVLEVLLVEDEPANQVNTSKMIRGIFPTAHIVVADNGEAAIEDLKVHDFKLVVSDVDILGQMSGIDVFEWVKANQPHLIDKFMFFTGNVLAEQVHHRVLLKPAGKKEFREAIWREAPSTRRTAVPTGAPFTAVPPRRNPGDFETEFNDAFDALDIRAGRNNYVLLYDLRQALPGYGRSAFDAELRKLRVAKQFSLDSADGRHVHLSDEQLAGGIQEAGSNLVYVARRERRATRARATSGQPSGPTAPPVILSPTPKAMASGSVNFAEDFEATFDRLDRNRSNYVLLPDLRDALSQFSRAQFDAGVRELRVKKLFSLDTADGRHVRLTDDQLAGGIREGGDNFMYVQRRARKNPARGRRRNPADPIPLGEFAEMVRESLPEIADETRVSGEARGRFGDRKVFVSALWRFMIAAYPEVRDASGMTFDTIGRGAARVPPQWFKEMLVQAHRQRLLSLARADLVAAMDSDEVAESEIRADGATFHFVVVG